MAKDKNAPTAAISPNPPRGRQGSPNRRSLIFRQLMADQGLLADQLMDIVVKIITKAELPGRVHPFHSQLKFLDKQINGRKKNRKAPNITQWEALLDEAERSLVSEHVKTSDRLIMIRDVIGYVFPKLRAIEHTVAGGPGTPQYGVLLISDPLEKKAWAELAEDQQKAALEAAAENAKDVNGD